MQTGLLQRFIQKFQNFNIQFVYEMFSIKFFRIFCYLTVSTLNRPERRPAGVVEAIARPMARFALCSFEGALLIARVQRSGEPLREVGRVLATQLRLLPRAPVGPGPG